MSLLYARVTSHKSQTLPKFGRPSKIVGTTMSFDLKKQTQEESVKPAEKEK
jgi:hypothetical protein